ncbi:MAG: hypothetical protein ACOZAM_03925 [Pseudomonadota bacterium]
MSLSPLLTPSGRVSNDAGISPMRAQPVTARGFFFKTEFVSAGWHSLLAPTECGAKNMLGLRWIRADDQPREAVLRILPLSSLYP